MRQNQLQLPIALIHSPFLGPRVWAPVAGELERRGRRAITTRMPQGPITGPADVLAALEDSLPREPLIIAVHSNAGLYAPALTRSRDVGALLFVDAILPPPAGAAPVAPPALIDFLKGKVAADGTLPPWTHWWPDASDLFPGPECRREIEREQMRVPFGYLTASVEIPGGWDRTPAAYLAFGDAYAQERTDAVSRGMPVRTMHGNHLHMLCDPAGVASTMLELLREIC